MDIDIATLGAHDALAALAARRISAVDLLEACLARIAAHNPRINALVTLDPAGARDAARAADARRRDGDSAPLLGLPISVKDAFASAGLRTTSSHPPLHDHVPTRDATVLARLRAAGAILVGKSNLPELAGDPQCWSPLFGPTHNPWEAGRTPGGSSGGSAAAVAMGFSLLEAGSDLAGSIRIPAAYCGVAGIKATENRIARSGHIPHLPGQPRTVRHLLSFGLLGRRIADLQLGLPLIAGPDGLDTEVAPVPAPTRTTLPARPLRIAWWDDFDALPLCPRTAAALSRTVDRLRAAGMTVTRAKPADFDFARALQLAGVVAGAEIGLGLPPWQRRLLRCAAPALPRRARLMRAIAAGMRLDLRAYSAALDARDGLIHALDRFLQDWDLWLCPVAPTTAYPAFAPPRWGAPPEIAVGERRLPYFDATLSLTLPFSLTGNPVVSLPAGIVDGLPVGLQAVGRRWEDEVLLARCAKLEAVLGPFQPPPAGLQAAAR